MTFSDNQSKENQQTQQQPLTLTALPSPPPIEVIVISDYVCAWCYIGKQAITLAAKRTRIPIKLIFQPYVINPNTPPGSTFTQTF